MLEKLIMHNNDNANAYTLIWSNGPVETLRRFDCSYSAEIHNMLDHGVQTYKNQRINVYERPTENRGCNDYDNTTHCIDIAHELDVIANGGVIRCPICGELVSKPYIEGTDIELECGCHIDIGDYDDNDTISMYDYFEDNILDIEYTINGDLSYKAARIMIAFGGPNIYIDTNSCRVELHWWSDTAYATLSGDTINAIDAYFEDEYNCRRGW